jgi:hypothetical protein
MAKNAWIMMQEPIKNKDEIQDKIDLAKYYLNKIPYSDTDKMNKAWRVVHSFTLLEKNLQEAISKNKPSRMLKRMR